MLARLNLQQPLSLDATGSEGELTITHESGARLRFGLSVRRDSFVVG